MTIIHYAMEAKETLFTEEKLSTMENSMFKNRKPFYTHS